MFPKGLNPLLWESIHSRDQGFRGQQQPGVGFENSRGRFEILHYDIWSSVVNAYSSQPSLHRPDKLHGLADPAQEMQRIVKDDYIDGHWLSTLSWSLLWTPAKQMDQTMATGINSSPSWSWIGWDGEVQMRKSFSGRSLVEFVGVEKERNDKSPGVSLRRILTLRGRCSIVQVSRPSAQAASRCQTLLKDKRFVDTKVQLDMNYSKSGPHSAYQAFWLRSSNATNQPPTFHALLLTYDEEQDLYTRRGVCSIMPEKKPGAAGYEWCEDDILYVSEDAQTINIR